MRQCGLSLYDVVSLLVQAATGFVMYLTYRAIVRYTEETRQLAEAAVEQIPRPLIKLDPLPSVPMSGGAPIGPDARVTMRNAGSAAAMNLRFQLRPTNVLVPEMFEAVPGPVLAPGESFATNHPKNALTDPCGFIAEYESPGGAHYRYRAVIVNKASIEGERYERVAKQ